MGQLELFEYDQLEQSDRDFIQGRTLEIKSLVKRSAQDIVDIGLKFLEVKERLPHGIFTLWLEKEFDGDIKMAQRFMNVAQRFKNDKLSFLSFAQSALYLLASPSTPDEAIDEAIDRASQGETITHKMAKEIVVAHKETKESQPAQPPAVSPVASCPVCRNLYDIGVFTDGCPYCYKEQNDLPGWVEGLPGKMKEGNEIEPNATRPMKPKLNQSGSIYEPKGYDACQTPAYAIDPLLPYLDADWVIWEPAAGENNLVEALYDSNYNTDQVTISDILTGQNFFEFKPEYWDCLITNPPYSIKYQWLERCYQLGKPFALLVPVEILGAKTAQILLKQYGFEMMLLNKRVDFKMPNKGWDSSAQFPVLWLCWQILPDKVMFGEINKNG